MGQINTKLTDTPNTPSPGYAGIFISTGLVPTLIDDDGNEVPLGGATNFTELLDVPSVYTGQSGKAVTVKATEDGLEFTTPSGGGTVTSVAITGTDGIEVDSGSPITGAGTITLGLNAGSVKTLIGLPNGTVNGQLLRWNNDTSVYEIATDAKIRADLVDITITDGVDTSFIYQDPQTYIVSVENGAGLLDYSGGGWYFVGGLYVDSVSAGNEVAKKSELYPEAVERANNTVLFDQDYIIGNAGTRTGNILFDFTGAKLGATTEMLHDNDGSYTFPTEGEIRDFELSKLALVTGDVKFGFTLVNKTASSEVVDIRLSLTESQIAEYNA